MTFQELGIQPEICQAVEELGFVSPMPIQQAVIQPLLDLDSEKPNMIALAQTGTGKTAAYGLPLVQQTNREERYPQMLILSPTRELCLQIADDLKDFSKYLPGLNIVAVYGGTGMEQQMRALSRGAQIIVATPGRLIDLKNRGYAALDRIKTILLDEADEMLNMGFQESIDDIFDAIPAETRKLLFSATMSREVERVAKKYINEYQEIVVGSRNEGAENVNHVYYLVNAKDKYLALKRVCDYYPKIYAIIFCRTKLETQDIADRLIRDGYNAESLHGDLSQPQRDQTMQKFRQHTVQLLVATDVAARGLDVDDLTHVINFSLPDDIESYTHRSGRTGRAGKNGTSISIIHTKEKHKVRAIEKTIGKNFVDGTLPTPEEICTKQLYKAMDQIMKMDVEEEQIAPFMTEINRHFEYVDKEDLLKKIVSMTFGRFLSYYADAPEIEKPATKKQREEERRQKNLKAPRQTEEGYTRLFINLGKDDGFYPGEVMQFLNKNIGGRQKVGHIDLYAKFAYIEIPSDDAENVMASLTGKYYRGRLVRCNPADEGRPDSATEKKDHGRQPKKDRSADRKKSAQARREAFSPFGNPFEKRSKRDNPSNKGKRGAARHESGRRDDWRQFFQGDEIILDDMPLRGPEPDFSEEGWARRRPKKK